MTWSDASFSGVEVVTQYFFIWTASSGWPKFFERIPQSYYTLDLVEFIEIVELL